MFDSRWIRVSPQVYSRIAIISLVIGLLAPISHGRSVETALPKTLFSQKAPAFLEFYDNSTSQPLLQMIAGAQKSLKIEVYQMSDGNVLAALYAAMGRGVRIDVVQDKSSSGCGLFEPPVAADKPECKVLKKLVTDVRAKGGTYVPFEKALCGKVAGSPCYQHGKMVIADDQVVLVSSGNFNSTNLCSQNQSPRVCNRDYSVVTNDPEVIKTLAWVFLNDLKGVAYDLTPVLNMRRKLSVSPLSMQPLVELVATAKASIVIQNQYLWEPNFNNAIMAAAQRGVKVFVMTASPCSFGRPDENEKARLRSVFEPFEKVGIVSRFFTAGIKVGGKPGYLHAKTVVVDGQVAWVGSVNGSTSAFLVNREFGLFFAGPQQVQRLYSILEKDFKDPAGQTWQQGIECQTPLN